MTISQKAYQYIIVSFYRLWITFQEFYFLGIHFFLDSQQFRVKKPLEKPLQKVPKHISLIFNKKNLKMLLRSKTLQHPTSKPHLFKDHPTSSKQHPTSQPHLFKDHPTSSKQHPASSKQHPTPRSETKTLQDQIFSWDDCVEVYPERIDDIIALVLNIKREILAGFPDRQLLVSLYDRYGIFWILSF